MKKHRSFDKPKKLSNILTSNSDSELNKLLIKGYSLHQNGSFKEAQKIYHEALNLQPKNFDALQISGALALEMKQYDKAVTLLSSAIEMYPSQAAVYFNLALALQELKEYDSAIENFNNAIDLNPNYKSAYFNCAILHAQRNQFEIAIINYNEVIKLDSKFADAFYNKGLALYELGEFEQAITSYDSAIKLNNRYLEAYFNRGVSFDKLNNYHAAIINYDQVIKINSNFVEAYYNKGLSLFELGKFDEAINNYDSAIKLNHRHLRAYFNRGVALDKLNDYHAAIINYDRVIKLNSDYFEAYSNKGLSLSELHCFDDAIACYDKAIHIKPDYAEAFFNRGAALFELKKFDAAIESYDQAIKIDPNFAEAYWNKSIVKLILGEYIDGWMLYEWRWKIIALPNGYILRNFEQALWLGDTSIKDKVILIHAEQGLGDTIQFCRYITMIEALAPKKIILEAPKALLSLLSTLKNQVTLIEQGSSIPKFDLHCPLMSLPHAFKTTVDTIPAKIPYLYAEANKAKLWQSKLGLKKNLRVGIAWSGSLGHKSDTNGLTRRNIPLDRLGTLFELPFEFHLLQNEIRIEDQLMLNSLTNINCHHEELIDFADTAALSMQMDLVISICTSIAHLAGALGIKTLLLLPYSADFRWMSDRNDSPWYPNTTLFRQPEIDDWDSVIEQVNLELNNFKQNLY